MIGKLLTLAIFITSYCLVLCTVVLGVMLGLHLHENDIFSKYELDLYEIDVDETNSTVMTYGTLSMKEISVDKFIDDCYNETGIEDRLHCMRDKINSFYIYKIRDDEENINFTQLVTDGGDCGNWSDLWNHIGERFRYDVKSVRVKVEGNLRHRFSIISNEEGYCKVDQKQVDCFRYG